MNNVGLFFSSSTGNCESVARLICRNFYPVSVTVHDVLHYPPNEMSKYKNLIMGIPTWGRGDMQEDWEPFLTKTQNSDICDRRIALYGLGDQRTYPDHFADAMGHLYKWLKTRNMDVVGQWPADGYSFRCSQALNGKKFVGLAIDEDTQFELTSERVKKWVNLLQEEFIL